MIRPFRPVRALRRLLRSPSFTAASVVTLALGIGANAAIFSVAWNVLFKPLPYEEPDRLIGVWNAAPGLGFPEITHSAAQYFVFRDEARTLESLALYQPTSVSVTGTGRPQELSGIQTTWELLPTLGRTVQAGRWFQAADDRPEAAPTAVLAHGEALSRFGSEEEALGQVIAVSGVPTEIIGVLPPAFRVLDRAPRIALPLRFDRGETQLGQFNYRAIGRLAEGATPEAADAELSGMLERVAEAFPGGLSMSMLQEARFATFTRPLLEDLVGNVRQVLWVLLGTVGVLLLVAFANVTNLFLVRAEGRNREIALRTAVGASRGDLVRQFLGESLLLGVLGGLLGVGFAWVAIRVLVALAPSSLPRLHEIGINAPVWLFAAALSLVTGIAFGLFPAFRLRSHRLAMALREGGRSSTRGRRAHLVRNGLVVAQIALALVLLIGSGLMLRSFQRLLSVDPGFGSPEQVLTFGVSLPGEVMPDAAEVARFEQRLIEELSRLPGVVSAAGTSALPLSDSGSQDGLWVEGHMPAEGQLPPIRRWQFATGDYFETLQRPMIAGRPIQWSDLEQQRRVAVITENLALEYWDSAEAALGRRVKGHPEHENWWEIVGVASDVHGEGIDRDPQATVYFPASNPDLWGQDQFVYRHLTYALRTEEGVDPAGLVQPAQAVVWGMNPELPVTNARTMEDIYRSSFASTAFAMTMLGIASSVALLLGLVGVYSTLSYIISQRTQELGVRIALGAQRGQVRGMVLRQGLLLAVVGVGLGVGGAVAVTRVLARLTYGVSATDTLTFGAVSVALVATVALATLLAARRATSVSPLEALRGD